MTTSWKRRCCVVSLVFASLAISCPVTALHVQTLLSTCADACSRGCDEIRAVQAKRQDTGSDLKFELKDESDDKSALTEADCAAQAAICGALRADWGDGLNIVGEEDNDEGVASRIKSMKFEPLKRDIFDNDFGETLEIDASEVTVFVDPLDATREFVEGRLANCQVLVGIAIGGEAVAGAVGIPFPAGDLSTGPTIVYGLANHGTGILGEPLTRGPFPLDQNTDGIKFPRPQFASGDSTTPVMKAAREAAVNSFGGSNIRYGGAGNKILAAALGEVAGTIGFRYGGPWDVCAPEAILKAMGGRMTDLFGEEVAIYRTDAPARCNERGYLATPASGISHEALVAALRPAVQQYRADVVESGE